MRIYKNEKTVEDLKTNELKKGNEHNYGVDLIKVLSMIMVVFLHILGHGGVLKAENNLNFCICMGLETVAFVAVNCFGITSGYLMIDRKFKYRKILPLYATVFLYCLIFFIIRIILEPQAIKNIKFGLSIFPVLSNQYWYFTAYFIMFLFIPFINHMIDTISEKSLCVLLFSGFVVVSAYTLFSTSTLVVLPRKGYSVYWLVFLYVLGAGIKKYNLFMKLSVKKAFLGFALVNAFTYLSYMAMRYVVHLELGQISKIVEKYGYGRFVEYTSPTYIFAAVFLFVFCLKISIPKAFYRPLKFLAPLVFQVYIIHENQTFFKFVINGCMIKYREGSPVILVLMIFAWVFGIFFGCLAIDWVRLQLFKTLKVNQRLDKTADWFCEKFKGKFKFLEKYM